MTSRLGVLDARSCRGGQLRSLKAWLSVQAALHLDPVSGVALLERVTDPADPVTALRAHGLSPLSSARANAAVETLARAGVQAVPFLSDAYPERLRALPDAAPLLLVRGHLGVLHGRAVAIVGARAATVYGTTVAAELAAALAEAGVVVVSGLARGIDAAAHRAALAAGGLTVAFLACGPDRMYPAEHGPLAEEICARGAVVTEMPPGVPPLPGYFPLRNRLIAALAEVVVVVEARARSGSLVTARRAADHGVEVLAVPGPITAPTSAGTNRLLRDGVAPVLGPADIFRALNLPVPTVRRSRRRKLGTRAQAIVECLSRTPANRDDLARRLALEPPDLALELMELELSGDVRLDRDGRLHVVRDR